MQLIQLLDGSIVEIESIETINGNLEIIIANKTAEEIQGIFQNKANLSVISLLTDSGTQSAQLIGFVCYSGLFMLGDEKKITLTKETDKDSMRITEAEANALVASMRAEKAEVELIAANNRIAELETQITDTQLAIIEIYESMEV